MTTITSKEAAQLESMRASLHHDGYVEIEQHGELKVGTRVRHRGQQWPEALEHGTGEVVAVTERPNSPWAAKWGMPDVELIVLFDRGWPLPQQRLAQLAQYHVGVVRLEVSR